MTTTEQIDAMLDRWTTNTADRRLMQLDLLLIVGSANHDGYAECGRRVISDSELRENIGKAVGCES